MNFIKNLIPLNVIALIIILLHDRGIAPAILGKEGKCGDYDFLALVGAVLLLTLSYELVKATLLAPSGSGSWVDFFMSFGFVIALIGYAVFEYAQTHRLPSAAYGLLTEAQILDVMVGFVLAISNARRDLNLGGGK